VLDKLCDLLVELDHVWFPVYEFLDLGPIRELCVSDLSLGASSEGADEAAE
jgi:hypothetical protein